MFDSNIRDYLFEFTDEDSDLCGQSFVVEVEGDISDAFAIAQLNFPNEELYCSGEIPSWEVELGGWDVFD